MYWIRTFGSFKTSSVLDTLSLLETLVVERLSTRETPIETFNLKVGNFDPALVNRLVILIGQQCSLVIRRKLFDVCAT